VNYHGMPELSQMTLLDGLLRMLLHGTLFALALAMGLIAGLCLLDGYPTSKQ
jgi:hypothetical protein